MRTLTEREASREPKAPSERLDGDFSTLKMSLVVIPVIPDQWLIWHLVKELQKAKAK